ncbi:ABC transporter fused permease/ATP-binding protein [Catalinimonas alkaloidigena]|uniref:ABC transporter ATP-binding protein n=1 Tax=Catalinimonas alkaloidigena TaxID=1075417 RepID=UPI002404E59D|nr:ABC transporter transmembrane domain-containing protein [Catalinimonas alkaloidigena]MDF9794747.1 ABC transporter fused permease/ATP-binding protein [Catalinimonas alkaloidigena]
MADKDTHQAVDTIADDKTKKVKLNKKSFQSLLGIYKFIVPYRWQFTIGIVSLVFSSLTLLTFPLASGELIDVASGNTSWIGESIDMIALTLLGIFLIQSIFSFIRVYFFAQVNEKSMADIRLTLYSKLMSLPMTFYDQHRTGEIISRITSDVSLLQNTFSTTLAEFLRQFATLFIGIIVISLMAPKLTAFMLATFPVLVILSILFGRKIRELSKNTQDQLADTNVIVEETLQAIQAVKSFTSELFEIKKYNSALTSVVSIALKAAVYRGLFISFVIFVLFGGIVAVIWYGASLVEQGDITIGELISFILYTTLIGGSIAGLGDLYGQIQKAVGASERVLDILNQQEELDPTQYYKAKPDPVIQGSIAFKNVAFSYPTRNDVQVLTDISFQINKGEKIALVGHSGAGKSTITQLLLRYYDVDQGKIMVDGQNISAYDLLEFRKHIGIVPQEVILFGGSIKENIMYGRPGASLEEVRLAAQKANAHDFIEGFPEGYHTKVGERGVKLSGGQRQRVAIARAILKNPEILILDEATSSLDAESEHLVQQALDRLMENRTTIIIAHRLATIKKVDRIYVLKGGEIVEQGTHEQLNTLQGDYSNLVKLQLQED